MRPGEGGGACPKAAPPSLRPVLRTARPRRILDGNEAFVGVAGRTLTDAWGDLGIDVLCVETEIEGEVMLMEEVDEALEWVWWW